MSEFDKKTIIGQPVLLNRLIIWYTYI